MKKLVLFLLLIHSLISFSQQAVPASGGTVTNALGSFSITLGQATSGYFQNNSNSMTLGVQQTYVSSTTQIQPAQCNTVLAQLDTAILADPIDGAQKYRFEVSNANDIRTIESDSSSFTLVQIEGGPCFNTIYAIRVAVQYAGMWHDYGTSCTLTTPDLAPTAVPQTFCGVSTVANLMASGTDVKWYTSANDGAALASSTAVATGTYFASQTVNGCESTRTAVTVTVTPVTMYYADNDNDGYGNPSISQQSCTGAPTGYVTNNIDCNDNNNAASTAIVISNQPTNATICKAIGARATISVAVEGATPTYQWYSQSASATTWTALSNNANYAGANTATLNITKTTATVPASGTKYRVVVTNSCGIETSSIASITDLTVLSKAATIAVVSKLMPALTVCEGNSVNLSVAAGSVGNIQWQSSTDGITYQNVGDLISQSALSASNAALPFNTGVLNQTTWFRVVASNGVCSSVNGTAIRITVSSPAVAGSISGGDVTVCAPITTGLDTNGNALTAAITNSTTLTLNDYTADATILWQKSTNFNTASPSWSAAGSTANTFVATNLSADTWFRALVTNGACSATTAVTKITVNKAAKAGATAVTTNGIVTASVCTGGDITFTSAAYMGTAIQWEVSTTSAITGFEPVEGATAASFTMNNIGYAPLSKFYVRSVVTNGDCTSARSAVKTIMVNPMSVAGTIKGGGILCSNGGSIISVSGNIGTIQWQYSTDGITYADAPYYKIVLGVPTYVNPNGTTEFSIPMTTTGIGATYVFTNFNTVGTVYFRAKIKSGACSEAYTSSVQYVNGLLAVAGTISAAEAIICPSTGTTLTLTGAVGDIQWQKAAISSTTRLPGIFASINGQTGTTLLTGNLTASTAYRALVTIGDCSTVTAAYVPVVVVEKPITKNSTTNKTVPAGTNAAPLCTSTPQKVLTIGPGSTGVIQWQKSTTSATTGFTDIEGANDSSYIVTNPAAGVNYYRAKFTTSCGLSLYNTAVSLQYKNCSVIAKVAETKVVPAVAEVPFDVMAYPNPFSNTFNLQVITTSTANVEVNVYDASSRLIDRFEVSSAEVSGLRIGDNYPAGTYNLIVSQGTEMKTVRVIKK